MNDKIKTYWIARDQDGQVSIFASKPERNKVGQWVSSDRKYYGTLPCFIVPKLKWENEPIQVEIKEI